jgi:hypothetical protein
MAIVSLIRLAGPLLRIKHKHRNFLKKTVLGLRLANPQFSDLQKIANKNLVAKYYELLWFDLLDKVSVTFGIWLVSRTHVLKFKIQ